MNKPIKLPPLPMPDQGSAFVRGFVEDDAKLESWCRAAIESDRQRRGEPVAFAKNGVLFWNGDHALWRGFDGDLYLSPHPPDPQECGCCGRSDGCDPDCDAARPAEPVKVPSDDLRTLQNLLSWAEAQICLHEETHRGGAIWEICDQCGAKWADDEGGRPAFERPNEITDARALLAKYGNQRTN